MLQHVVAIVGLGVLCAAWVLLQRWVGRGAAPASDEQTHQGCGCGGCGRHARRPDSPETM